MNWESSPLFLDTTRVLEREPQCQLDVAIFESTLIDGEAGKPATVVYAPGGGDVRQEGIGHRSRKTSTRGSRRRKILKISHLYEKLP